MNVCVPLSLSKSFSLPQTTLASHFQNATVDFLQPIEDPITISFAALLFAHNDRQNVSLVCPHLSSPPLRSLSLSWSLSLYLTCSVLKRVILSYPPPTHISASVRNERGGEITGLCVVFQIY